MVMRSGLSAMLVSSPSSETPVAGTREAAALDVDDALDVRILAGPGQP